MREMPIRVCCVKRLESPKLTRVFEPGQVEDFYGDKVLLKEFPDYFVEIEMSQEDWERHATQKAMDLKNRIELLLKCGVKFSSYYLRVIPLKEGEVVNGSGFGGGFPDAYAKLEMLENDVKAAEQSVINNKSQDNNKETDFDEK